MREAFPGEVWEWCVDGDPGVPEHLRWEPVLLLRKGKLSTTYTDEKVYDWWALDLLSGEVCEVFNVPRIGWEKVE